jgi:membrane protein CcdC involved in cytochrome C biogenesis
MRLVYQLRANAFCAGIGGIVGALLTVPVMLLAFISAGGGHGDYLGAMLLLPYAMVIPTWCDAPMS